MIEKRWRLVDEGRPKEASIDGDANKTEGTVHIKNYYIYSATYSSNYWHSCAGVFQKLYAPENEWWARSKLDDVIISAGPYPTMEEARAMALILRAGR